MMFREVPFIKRFEKAKMAGFRGVECLFDWMDHRPETIAEELHKHDLSLVLFNLPPGDRKKGDAGLAALPRRQQEFDASLELAAEYARICQCECVHVMAGIAGGATNTNTTKMEHDVTFTNNLATAVQTMDAATGVSGSRNGSFPFSCLGLGGSRVSPCWCDRRGPRMVHAAFAISKPANPP